jgi:hypothetical protein
MLTKHDHRLAAVNFFLGCVGVVQVGRIYNWRRSQEGSDASAAKELVQEVEASAKGVVEKTEAAVKKS